MNYEDAHKISMEDMEKAFCTTCRHMKSCEEACDFFSDLEGFLQRYQEDKS